MAGILLTTLLLPNSLVQFYHIITRGDGRRKLFHPECDCQSDHGNNTPEQNICSFGKNVWHGVAS